MAPRRFLLLLAVAAACSLLAASPVRAGTTAAEPTAFPRTVLDDGDGDLLRGIQPYLRPIVVRGATATDPGTSYDVTVVFRATRRVGPPRLNYAVLPAADDEEEQGALVLVAIFIAMFAVIGLMFFALSFVVP